MRIFVIAGILFALLNCTDVAEAQVLPKDPRKVEATMAKWLADPLEYGVKPVRVKYLTSLSAPFAGEDRQITVHIVEYRMPGGEYGKGFVGPLTWAFEGSLPYDKLTDRQLVAAYTGWLWLFSTLQKGTTETQFTPSTRDKFIHAVELKQVEKLKITSQYRVVDSEIFEFVGQGPNGPVKGAGSLESQLILDAASPEAALPVVYTYLAKVMKGEM